MKNHAKAVKKLLKDDEWSVVCAALQVLNNLDEAQLAVHAKSLVKALKSAKEGRVRQATEFTLKKLGLGKCGNVLSFGLGECGNTHRYGRVLGWKIDWENSCASILFPLVIN